MTSKVTLSQLHQDARMAIQSLEIRVTQLQVISIKSERLWLKVVLRQARMFFPELRPDLESLVLHEELSYVEMIDKLAASGDRMADFLSSYAVELQSITEHAFDLVYSGDEEAVGASNIEAYRRHFVALKREREAVTQRLEEYQSQLESAEKHLSTDDRKGSAVFGFIQIINDLENVRV